MQLVVLKCKLVGAEVLISCAEVLISCAEVLIFSVCNL